MIQDGARPALIVAPGEGESYKDPDVLPPADDVQLVVVDAIEEVWGSATDFVIDARSGEVKVQHESPPTDPYDTQAVVIVFDQLPLNDYNQYDEGGWSLDKLESPYLLALKALSKEYGTSIEIWIDAVQTQSRRKPAGRPSPES